MAALPLTRRGFVAAALAFGLAPAVRAESLPVVRVAKDPNCGCCGAWVTYLEADGFAVEVSELDYDALAALKAQKGIPVEAQSCHTAEIDGYVIEGHVPAADIRRLLAERPQAVGISVPGMPFGSPGMGPESRREAYDVLLVLQDGTTEVFTAYAAAKA